MGGSTVYRIKRRFVFGHLEAALSEEPRPGAGRKLWRKEEVLLVATAEIGAFHKSTAKHDTADQIGNDAPAVPRVRRNWHERGLVQPQKVPSRIKRSTRL